MLHLLIDEDCHGLRVTYNDHRRTERKSPGMASGLRYHVAPTGAFDELIEDDGGIPTVDLLSAHNRWVREQHRRKQAFIDRLNATDRIAEDVPGGDMTFAEIMAAALADPDFMAREEAAWRAKRDAFRVKARAALRVRREVLIARMRADLAIRVAMVPYFCALIAQAAGGHIEQLPEQRDGHQIDGPA